jgi:hypothetical protein
MAKKPLEAPEFALLQPSTKALIRKIGNTQDHMITSEEGKVGKGWLDAEDMGWVSIRIHDRYGMSGGYTISFNLTGWERWCRQVDVEDGMNPADLPPCEFD